MIVIDEQRAVHIESTAIEILKKNTKKWASYSKKVLEDQQELYLESLSEFDNFPPEIMSEEADELFFNICVYLAIFRILLQAKVAKLPPTPLSIVPIEIDNPK